MNSYYDVVVIGGGLAGLTAGAYISRDGHSVLVCEQSDQTGGYFRSFRSEGFVFDAGLKAVENAGMLKPMLHQLGLENKVNLLKSNAAMFIADRLVALKDGRDIHNVFGLLAEHFPDQRKGLQALEKQTDRISQWVNIMVTLPNPLFEDPRHILGRLPAWLFHNLPALMRFRSTGALLEVSLTDFLGRYLNNSNLIRILTELYFGGTPALFGLGYSKLYLDYYYPKEGMQSLTNALGNYIVEKGGQIGTRTKVTAISVINGQATGIQLEDGKKINSRYVVAAADMRSTFLDLVAAKELPPDFRARIEQAEIGESAVCVFLGTDIPSEKLPVQGCPHLYVHPDCQGIEANERMKDDIFSRTPVEVSIPCLKNPDLAPPGRSGLIISALAKSGFSHNWETQGGKPTPAYYELKEKVADQLISIAEKVIPELHKHILFRQTATPYTYRRYTLNSGGSICGWSYDRTTSFHRRGTPGMGSCMLSPVRNLLQAGHWTVYPGGAPVSILSGRMAAAYVHRHISR